MAAAAAPVVGRLEAAPLPAGAVPEDEAYWAKVAAQYDVIEDIIQLENGNWGMMARPVLEQYEAAVRRVNRATSYYARRGLVPDLIAVRARVAAKLGVAPEEIAFTRNATEALKALIGGYNRLRPVTPYSIRISTTTACRRAATRSRRAAASMSCASRFLNLQRIRG